MAQILPGVKLYEASVVIAEARAPGEAMMSAVRISAAASARRGRIAFFMGIFTPAVGGAGSCARMNRPGEPFAALSGRPAVGRGCPHHLLRPSIVTCDLFRPAVAPRSNVPTPCARANRPCEGGSARTEPGRNGRG